MLAFWITQFGSTYRCEQGFSVMKLNISKLRSQLTDRHLDAVMRIAITLLKANFRVCFKTSTCKAVLVNCESFAC